MDKVIFRSNGGDSQVLASGLTYSPLGQITRFTYGNNASTTNTYDESKLYRLSNKTSGKAGTKFQDLTYTYDAVGNVTKIVDVSNTNSAKTVDYLYDDLHRLTSASTTAATGGNYLETYSYSNIGNISTKSDLGTYSYNGHTGLSFANPHAVTSINGSAITYDPAGNLLGTGLATSTWNYNNRLSKIISQATTTSYFYDPNGDRLTTKINTQATSTTITPFYEQSPTPLRRVYIGDELIATIVGTESAVADFGDGEEDFFGPGGLIVHYIHDDHLSGSNVSSSEAASLEELTDYYPYGKIKLNTSTTGFKERKKYTGHEYDADTELTYAKARYYSGTTGRFQSQDPMFLKIGSMSSKDQTEILGNPQKLNAYSYVENNPLRHKDPDGEKSIDKVNGVAYSLWGAIQGTALFIPSLITQPSQTAKSVVNSVTSIPQQTQELGSMIVSGDDFQMAQGVTNSLLLVGSIIDPALRRAQKMKILESLPDSALVCRSGPCAPDDFTKGTGVKTGTDGKLSGVSVNIQMNSETPQQLLNMGPDRYNGEGWFATLGQLRDMGVKFDPKGEKLNKFELDGQTGKGFSNSFSNGGWAF